jgi:hypothetical protein
MIKKIFTALILLLFLNIIFINKYKFYSPDAISCATSSSSSSSDKSKTSQKKHKSYALKVILNDKEKSKNQILKEQIDNCFIIINSLKKITINNEEELDIIQIYLLLEEYNSLIPTFTQKESKSTKKQLTAIKKIIPRINNFLEEYNNGTIDSNSLKTLEKDIKNLSVQYRAIQWILYI